MTSALWYCPARVIALATPGMALARQKGSVIERAIASAC